MNITLMSYSWYSFVCIFRIVVFYLWFVFSSSQLFTIIFIFCFSSPISINSSSTEFASSARMEIYEPKNHSGMWGDSFKADSSQNTCLSAIVEADGRNKNRVRCEDFKFSSCKSNNFFASFFVLLFAPLNIWKLWIVRYSSRYCWYQGVQSGSKQTFRQGKKNWFFYNYLCSYTKTVLYLNKYLSSRFNLLRL